MASTKLQLRRDTEADWQASNPVLLDGELVVVFMADGEVRLKIGNGMTAYKDLLFADAVTRNLIDEKLSNVIAPSAGVLCVDDGAGNITMVLSD